MVTEEQRAAIFEMRGRTPPVPYQKIADQLGLAVSQVHKEHHRPARSTGGDESLAGGLVGPRRAAVLDDPELASATKRLELKKLELAEMELDRRRALLERPGAAADNSTMLLLLDQLRDVRGQIAQVTAQVSQRPPAPPQPSVTDKLNEMRQLSEVVQSFAPPRAPNSATEIEFKVALERVNAETRRIELQLETEREERLERARGQARRDEAVALAIEQTLPLIGQGINQWLANQGQNGAAQPGAIRPLIPEHAGPTPTTEGLHEGEIAGACPGCQRELAVMPADPGSCPQCQTPLAVQDGRIVKRQAEGGIRRIVPVAS